MLFRSRFLLTVLLGLIFVISVQSEQVNSISSHHSKSRFPSMMDEEASQWLSTRNLPHRWHHQRNKQPSNEIDRTLKQLQALNDNGVRQFDTQSFEGVSMEVIFEMVYKQQNNGGTG
jgi:hypothetical protein